MASATAVGDQKKLVLRKGVEIGVLSDIVGWKMPYPVLVLGEYSAQSSGGYTKQIGSDAFNIVVLGAAGFGVVGSDGIRRGDSLRPFDEPVPATLFPSWTRLSEFKTHKNSNVATAYAALSGLKLIANVNSDTFFLVEGQSDYTAAVSFIREPKGLFEELPIFKNEHRADIFPYEFIEENCCCGC